MIAVLAATILAVYWQVGHHPFISYDDTSYVSGNPPVRQGLTREGIAWASRTFHMGNWHPLTWVSHMADVELFGLDAGWHHRVNVLFHILNVALLFLILKETTGAFWRSWFVAALFAVHPLHVESVAWVSERKDLLCAFFGLLAVGAYVYYVRRPGLRRYVPVAVFFVLGLLCKPMLVTLPLVFLLMDYWPLQRFAPDPFSPRMFLPLIREKIPLLALSGISCLVTFLAQARGNAVKSLEHIPFDLRVSNALVSYVKYLFKTVWPDSLSVIYPHPAVVHASHPAWHVAGAALLLCAMSGLALWRGRRWPFLAVGWLWFLLTLVPVIGLVQVGDQAMADRYMYLPLAGVLVAIAWGAPEVLKGWRFRNPGLGIAGSVVVLALAIASWVQAGYWRTGVSLFAHALEATENNWVAWNGLGVSYREIGRYDEAVDCYREALRLRPDCGDTWNFLGVAYGETGRYPEAAACFREALRIAPNYADAWSNLGNACNKLGQYPQAIDNYREALRLNPEDPSAWNNLGNAYGHVGRYSEAVACYGDALRFDPDFSLAWYNLGATYAGTGQQEKAFDVYQRLRRIDPGKADLLIGKIGAE